MRESVPNTGDQLAPRHAAARRPCRPRVLQVITKLDLGGAESVALDLVGALRHEMDFGVFGVTALAAPSPVGRDMASRLADWNVPFFAGTAWPFKTGGVLVAANPARIDVAGDNLYG